MDSTQEVTDKLGVERNGKLEFMPCQRIPLDYPDQPGRGEVCMGRTRNGEIYAAAGASVGAGGDKAKPSQRLFKSSDGGRSWTSRPIDFAGVNSLVAFTVLADDTLLFAGSDLYGERDCICFHQSVDGGQTWEKAGVIAAEPFEQIGEGFLSLTQLKDGTILFPVCRWNKAPEGTHPPFPQHVFRSTDGGATWQGGGGLKDADVTAEGDGPASRWPGSGGTFPGCFETHIIELADGKLLAVFRYSGSPLPWHKDMIEKWGGKSEPDGIGRFFKHAFLGDSSDGGRTWENLRPLFDAEGKPLLVLGECHGQLVKLPDGRVVLVHDLRYPYVKQATIGRVSADGGKTWSRDVYHLSDGGGYAASAVLDDGTIVTVTGNTRTDPTAKPIEPWSVQAVRWRVD